MPPNLHSAKAPLLFTDNTTNPLHNFYKKQKRYANGIDKFDLPNYNVIAVIVTIGNQNI